MDIASVSSKGQVVIPKAIRDRLGLKPGARVQFIEDGEGSVRLAVARRSGTVSSTIAEGYGLAGYKGPRISDEQMRVAIRRKAASRG